MRESQWYMNFFLTYSLQRSRLLFAIHKGKARKYFMDEKESILDEGQFIDVDTGKVRVSSKPVILRSLAIGSCVVVTIYEKNKKIGGLAHVMLPGRSPKKESEEKTKYTEDAIDALLDGAVNLGAEIKKLEVCLVGGANILGEGYLPDIITQSILQYLKKLGIEPKGVRLGGARRRSAYLEIDSGRLLYAEGEDGTYEL